MAAVLYIQPIQLDDKQRSKKGKRYLNQQVGKTSHKSHSTSPDEDNISLSSFDNRKIRDAVGSSNPNIIHSRCDETIQTVNGDITYHD
jgi:hypothetical protein